VGLREEFDDVSGGCQAECHVVEEFGCFGLKASSAASNTSPLSKVASKVNVAAGTQLEAKHFKLRSPEYILFLKNNI
jgi:hypothetical protein